MLTGLRSHIPGDLIAAGTSTHNADEPKRVGALDDLLESLSIASDRVDALIGMAERANDNLFGAPQAGPAEAAKAEPAPQGMANRLGYAARYLNQRLERLHLELERIDNL